LVQKALRGPLLQVLIWRKSLVNGSFQNSILKQKILPQYRSPWHTTKISFESKPSPFY